MIDEHPDENLSYQQVCLIDALNRRTMIRLTR